MSKLLSALVTASMLGLAGAASAAEPVVLTGAASAAEPVALTDAQLATITAGASAAAASGDVYAQGQAADHVGPGGQTFNDFFLGTQQFQGESCTNCAQAQSADF